MAVKLLIQNIVNANIDDIHEITTPHTSVIAINTIIYGKYS